MKNIMGVINLINEPDQLEELTYGRTIAAVPFAGRYRLIDFIMSSMVNSGIGNVAVFAHTKYRSLMDHLGSGKEWDLDRKRAGLFILPPLSDDKSEISRGDLYRFYNQRDYFHRSAQEYVIVSRSHMVCNLNFDEVLAYHQEKEADITVVYKDSELQDFSRSRKLEVDDSGRVTEMQDHAGRSQSKKVSMEMFIMKKSLLLDLTETSLAMGYDHLVRDAIMKNIGKLQIYGYAYKGYLGIINTIQSYYINSMNMLDPDIWKSLFYKPGLIYTKIKDEPPTKYASSSAVTNSLVANGCFIEGTVQNSILFRGVKVAEGAVIKNSIVLQNSRILSNVRLENAILDKDVHVNRDKVLIGDPSAPFIGVKSKVI